MKGWEAVAEAIALLKADPMTLQQFAEATGWDKERCRRWLLTMHETGWVYIRQWVRPEGPGAWVAVYSYGNHTDAPRIGKAPGIGKMNTALRGNRMVELRHVLRIMEALKAEPISVRDISEQTGGCRKHLHIWLKQCRELGLVRIAGWGKAGACTMPLWHWGGGSDAPKPGRKSRTQSSTEYRKRKREMTRLPRVRTILAPNVAWFGARA